MFCHSPLEACTMNSIAGVLAVVALLLGAAVANVDKQQREIGVDVSLSDSPALSFTFNDHTYLVSNLKEDWQAAKYYCKALDMELVSIETEEEQLAIIENIAPIRDYYWTSLNDLYVEGTYVWESTGVQLGPYHNWGISEPSQNNSQHCMYMNSDSQSTWKMEVCFYFARYICESGQ